MRMAVRKTRALVRCGKRVARPIVFSSTTHCREAVSARVLNLSCRRRLLRVEKGR